jgi:hypothetical protein
MTITTADNAAPNNQAEAGGGLRLGLVLRKWRTMEDKTIREVADEMGIVHGNLQRLEKGEMPSAQTMAKVWWWLMDGIIQPGTGTGRGRSRVGGPREPRGVGKKRGRV